MQKSLTHVNNDGQVSMVDVAQKPDQKRIAIAEGFIRLAPDTINLVRENGLKKGDVLTIAKIAGIQAAKKTSDLIPLCHQLLPTKIDVQTTLKEDGVYITCEARCTGKTGVEMEALTGVSIALLTIYDMCKAVDKDMIIESTTLVSKEKINL